MLIFCEFAQFVDGQMEEQHNYNFVPDIMYIGFFMFMI